MRLVTFLIVLIILASGGYAAYSVLTFEPDRIAPLVFDEPNMAQLQEMGIMPAGDKPDVALDQTQTARADQALQRIESGMRIYQNYAKRATEPVKSTIDILNGAISSGKLPAYFLSDKTLDNPSRVYQTLAFNLQSRVTVQPPQSFAACESAAAGAPTSIIIGDENDNALSCAAPGGVAGDQIFLGGPGDDTITDTQGNRIVNAGSGNDTIKLGAGRSIIVLEEGWGNDTVTVDCRGAKVEPSEVPADFPVPWASKFSNFIVLSPRIAAQNVIWQGNTLTNISTGDQLTVNENCFTLVNANQ